MAVLFTNNAATTIAAAITTTGQTSVAVASGKGALFPSLSGGDVFYATITDGTNTEIVQVTARSTDTMTFTRSAEPVAGSSTPYTFASGSKFELRPTAAGLNSKFDKAGGAISGNVAITGTFSCSGNAAVGGDLAVTGGLTVGGVAVMTAASTNTLTNKTFDTHGTGNSLKFNGVIVDAASGTHTITLPTTATTLVGRDTVDTLTNKTITGLASASTVLDSAGTGYTIGYRRIPQNSQSGDYTLVLADDAKHIYCTNTGPQGITIPTNATIAFPVGTAIIVLNGGTTAVTIALATDTLVWAGSGSLTTGTPRTLAVAGMASLLKVGTTTWFISGTGIT